MDGSDFDEAAFFGALEGGAARVLLIGRRALVALGMPVLTADYDLWIHIDDIEAVNEAAGRFGLAPNHTPAEARARGRYVLENDEHVDVLCARAKTTKDGVVLAFEDAWPRRQRVAVGPSFVCLPSIDDLIVTKRWAMRDRDLVDIQYLEGLKRAGTETR